jgi:hypothetical protein
MPWAVYLLPQAEAELQLRPLAERAAVLNARRSWKRWDLILDRRTPVPCVTLTGSASCGPVAGGVPGGRFTAGSAMCSLWRQWVPRPRLIRGASGGWSRQRRRGWRGWSAMKLNELPTLGQVIDRQRENPEFRETWDRSAFAREVATRVVRYRAYPGSAGAGSRHAAVGSRSPGARRAAASAGDPGSDIGGNGDRAAPGSKPRCRSGDWLTPDLEQGWRHFWPPGIRDRRRVLWRRGLVTS